MSAGFCQSLLRNRRGMACVACCCLSFGVLTLFGVWAYVSILHGALAEFPAASVNLVLALSALKAWTYREDRVAESAAAGRVDSATQE